jgi:hypothetical protein
MSADLDVYNQTNGLDGNGVPLSYRSVYVRARTVLSNVFGKIPFSFPKGPPASVSEYDQIVGTSEQIAWRFVDSYGNVWDQKAVQLVLIQWWLDGAPTPLSLAKIAQYRANADKLNPWPTGFAGAMPGEPTQTYPAFPPAAATAK